MCMRCVIFNFLNLGKQQRQRQRQRWWWCLWWWLRTPTKWKVVPKRSDSHRSDNPNRFSNKNGHIIRVNNGRIDHHTFEYIHSGRAFCARRNRDIKMIDFMEMSIVHGGDFECECVNSVFRWCRNTLVCWLPFFIQTTLIIHTCEWECESECGWMYLAFLSFPSVS